MSGLGRGVRESTYIHSLSPALDLLLHCWSEQEGTEVVWARRGGQGTPLLCPRSFSARWAEKMNQIEATFLSLRSPICPSGCFSPPPANTALTLPGTAAARRASDTTAHFSLCLQEGAEVQNHLSSSAAPSQRCSKTLRPSQWLFLQHASLQGTLSTWSMENEMPLIMETGKPLWGGRKKKKNFPLFSSTPRWNFFWGSTVFG